jgi:hypothetical protein
MSRAGSARRSKSRVKVRFENRPGQALGKNSEFWVVKDTTEEIIQE